MSEDGYNGWKNYETWLVALWLDNERETYEYWREEARRIRKDAPRMATEWGVSHHEAATRSLACHLREQLDARQRSCPGCGETDLF